MGFIGNINGPRKSEIINKLGPAYFGISRAALNEEIEINLREEANKEIDPVYVDSDRRYYLLFSAPNEKTQRFYLVDHGYIIKGEVEKYS